MDQVLRNGVHPGFDSVGGAEREGLVKEVPLAVKVGKAIRVV